MRETTTCLWQETVQVYLNLPFAQIVDIDSSTDLGRNARNKVGI